uniref:TOG domain-containing protein n=1 Tax=Alexandrium catenella TaxID=2925 RepID=A0A7S1R3I5_ALECA
MLEDQSEAVRCAACAALGAFEASDCAGKLASLLSDKSPEVQGAACLALGKLGEVGTRSAADVAAKMQEPRSRLQAIHALGTMDKAGEGHCEAVVDCLEDQDADIRLAAAQLCGQMGKAMRASEGSWAKLTSLLGNSDGNVRCATAMALGFMGKEAADLSDSLKDMLEDDFSETGVTALTVGGGRARVPPSARKAKCAAAAALGFIVESNADVAVDVYAAEVANLVNDEDWEIRMVACEALAMMGEAAREQATRVSSIFDDERFAVRAKAALASGKMKDTEAASGLADLTGDNCPSVREEAVLALAELGDDGAEYIEKVFEKVSDNSPSVRAAAMTALSRMGMKGQCYAGAVAARLMEYDAVFVRIAAIDALGNMEEHGAAYAELVAESLEDQQPQVRAAAAAALGKMGPDGEAFGDVLKPLTKDPSSEVRKAASQAVSQLRI